jgi:hypothetical protein
MFSIGCKKPSEAVRFASETKGAPGAKKTPQQRRFAAANRCVRKSAPRAFQLRFAR